MKGHLSVFQPQQQPQLRSRQQPAPTGTRVGGERSPDSVPQLAAAPLVLSKSCSRVRFANHTTVVRL